MARMSIDDSVQRDPRITKLAKLAGWTRRETLGCLVSDVWPIAYDQKCAEVSADLIDLAAGIDGFARHMVSAELARWVRGNQKVRIAGAEERLKYLADKSTAGRVGGLKSAEVRNKKPSSAGSTPQAERNPPVPDLVLVPVPDKEARADKPRPVQVHPGLQEARDYFNGRFELAYASKMVWDGESINHIKRLLKSDSLDEFRRRVDTLFDSPPGWLKPPFDIRTLVSQWNKLVSAQPRFAVIPTRKVEE